MAAVAFAAAVAVVVVVVAVVAVHGLSSWVSDASELDAVV